MPRDQPDSQFRRRGFSDRCLSVGPFDQRDVILRGSAIAVDSADFGGATTAARFCARSFTQNSRTIAGLTNKLGQATAEYKDIV